MQTETLGRTGLTVGKLALGGLFVRSGSAELDEAKRVVRQAVESGVNYIDTAPGYGDSGKSKGQVCHRPWRRRSPPLPVQALDRTPGPAGTAGSMFAETNEAS